jgi:hypothetical protein
MQRKKLFFQEAKDGTVPLKIFPFLCFHISQAAIEKISMKKAELNSCLAFSMVSKNWRM